MTRGRYRAAAPPVVPARRARWESEGCATPPLAAAGTPPSGSLREWNGQPRSSCAVRASAGPPRRRRRAACGRRATPRRPWERRPSAHRRSRAALGRGARGGHPRGGHTPAAAPAPAWEIVARAAGARCCSPPRRGWVPACTPPRRRRPCRRRCGGRRCRRRLGLPPVEARPVGTTTRPPPLALRAAAGRRRGVGRARDHGRRHELLGAPAGHVPGQAPPVGPPWRRRRRRWRRRRGWR